MLIYIIASIILILLLGKLISNLIKIRKEESKLYSVDLSHISKDEILISYSELSVELQEARAINHRLSQRLHEERIKTDELKNNLTEYISHSSHQLRAPVARILGILYLFNHNVVKDNEMDFLLTELSSSAIALDDEIKNTTHLLRSGLPTEPPKPK